jgi:hypothetical protein
MTKQSNNRKVYRSAETIAYDHGKQLMAYLQKNNMWAEVEALLPILKELAPAEGEGEDKQKKLPV